MKVGDLVLERGDKGGKNLKKYGFDVLGRLDEIGGLSRAKVTYNVDPGFKRRNREYHSMTCKAFILKPVEIFPPSRPLEAGLDLYQERSDSEGEEIFMAFNLQKRAEEP